MLVLLSFCCSGGSLSHWGISFWSPCHATLLAVRTQQACDAPEGRRGGSESPVGRKEGFGSGLSFLGLPQGVNSKNLSSRSSGSQKSGIMVSGALAPPEATGGNPSVSGLVVAGNLWGPWLPAASLQSLPYLHIMCCVCMYVSQFLLFLRCQSYWIRGTSCSSSTSS